MIINWTNTTSTADCTSESMYRAIFEAIVLSAAQTKGDFEEFKRLDRMAKGCAQDCVRRGILASDPKWGDLLPVMAKARSALIEMALVDFCGVQNLRIIDHG